MEQFNPVNKGIMKNRHIMLNRNKLEKIEK